MDKNPSIRLAICGWGNVASAVYLALIADKKELLKKYNIKIVCIGARSNNQKIKIPKDIKVHRNIFDVLDEDIDVLLELIGGVDVAYQLISKAIKKKINVVTANKAVIYERGAKLFKQAKDANVSIYFESSVCAGTPIIKLLKTDLAANKISKISGMLNGTSNFILTQIESGNEYRSALKNAQALGYAEANPDLDVGGVDAGHKIGILASLAFNCSLPLKNFYIEGIQSIKREDFVFAKEQGYTIKHLAVAELKRGSEILVRAHPVMLPLDSNLGSLKGVRNGVEISTNLIGQVHLAGSGAGKESTASGVISDLIHYSKHQGTKDDFTSQNKFKLVNFSSQFFKYYFSIEVDHEPGTAAKVTSQFAKLDIGIDKLIQKECHRGDKARIIIITDSAQEKIISRLRTNLRKLSATTDVRFIRIES
ncbi:MAG: homoserine dehydrogenase [Gammaproteobacteria bacterium]